MVPEHHHLKSCWNGNLDQLISALSPIDSSQLSSSFVSESGVPLLWGAHGAWGAEWRCVDVELGWGAGCFTVVPCGARD